MKKIHLIRHAKSSWDNPDLADIHRPLSQRGQNAATQMAPHIYAAGCRFTQVFASPAVRAQSTIQRISQALPALEVQYQTDAALYSFSCQQVLAWVQSLDESIVEPVIVGHNPAFTDLSNQLSGDVIANIPTCGYVQLLVAENCSWQEIAKVPVTRKVFLKPKDIIKS